jgi:hypothetical protein
MNILFSWMNGHPEVVDALSGSGLDVVTLEPLMELAGNEEFPLPFAWNAIRNLREDELVGPLLERSYLPLLPKERWAEAIEQAEFDERVDEDRDWVVFAQGRDGARGVTMPDDASPMLRISLFVGTDSGARSIGLEYHTARRPVAVSLSVAQRCSLPDWGDCSKEECEGACGLRRAPKREGLVCVCPNE